MLTCALCSAFLEITKCIRLIRYSRVLGVGCRIVWEKMFKQKRFNDQSSEVFLVFAGKKFVMLYSIRHELVSWKTLSRRAIMAFAWFIQMSEEKKLFKKTSQPTISVRFGMEKSTLAILGSPQACDTNIKKKDRFGDEENGTECECAKKESNYVKIMIWREKEGEKRKEQFVVRNSSDTSTKHNHSHNVLDWNCKYYNVCIHFFLV